ncbi:MAG TPA: PilZ domain-containing protein [Planctomycetota bacterium]|nr:PilZ domain-containing protein [Planctomycetota bacterium]
MPALASRTRSTAARDRSNSTASAEPTSGWTRTPAPIAVVLHDAKGGPHASGLLRDLSTFGLAVLMPPSASIAPGAEVVCLFLLPESERPLALWASVVEAISAGPLMRYGLEFNFAFSPNAEGQRGLIQRYLLTREPERGAGILEDALRD